MKAFQRDRRDPEPSIAKCLELTAPARDVLVVGTAREALLQSLDSRGSLVTCIILTGSSLDEARVHCTEVHAALPDAFSLETVPRGSSFDAVILDGALDQVSDSSAIVRQSARVVRKGGLIVAICSSLSGVREAFGHSRYQIQHFNQFEGDHDGTRFVVAATTPEIPTGPIVPVEPVIDVQMQWQPEISARIASMGERRRQLQSDLDAQTDEVDRLQGVVDESKARIRELKRVSAGEQSTAHGLRLNLETERTACDRLRNGLQTATRALAAASEHVAAMEHALRGARENLECANSRTIELEGSLRARIAEATDLEGRLSLSRQEAREQRERAHRFAGAESGLKAQMASLNAQIVWLTATREELTSVRDQLKSDIAATRERLIETEQRLEQENRELRERIAEAEGALAKQVDATVDAMRAEGSKLSELVDIVQSSRFWRIKRWLNRLRGRALPS